MNKLKRISNVHQLIEMIAYVWWKKEVLADAVLIPQNQTKMQLDFQLDGKVIASVRRLTPSMVSTPWWAWFKQDAVFVDESLFSQTANDAKWKEIGITGRTAALRVMRTKLEVAVNGLVRR